MFSIWTLTEHFNQIVAQNDSCILGSVTIAACRATRGSGENHARGEPLTVALRWHRWIKNNNFPAGAGATQNVGADTRICEHIGEGHWPFFRVELLVAGSLELV